VVEGTHFLPRADEVTIKVRAADLEITAGPDAGRRMRIDRPTFVIGTGDSADLRLSDPAVSREHLRMTLVPIGLTVRDEGSKNGTWLDGTRLYDALLTKSAVVQLGSSTLAIRIDTGALELPLHEGERFGGALGVSASMRHLFGVLERASASDVTVLIEGESGVGKEVLARAVHDRSPRADGPFVAVDCGAIAPTLIEAELFGHEKGAFTGAAATRPGMFEEAEGGTIFLDEIGELSLDLQPKLLRVLEAREVRRVGGGARPLNVRVIAATNRRLSEASEKGEFRRDLYYRLAVARVTVPPLRDRPEDIAPIAREFLRTALGDPTAELPRDLEGLLSAYRWPGNVRELRNVVDRYALLGARDATALFDASASQAAPEDLSDLPYHEARRRALERFERAYLPSILARAGGVVSKAAELAQVARPSFYRMLDRNRVSSDD
jgi:transcriptional regulator with PAS, ATPase and Fis domain